MQSNKASNKTRKVAEQTTPAADAGRAKHRTKASAPAPVVETPAVAPVAAPRTAASVSHDDIANLAYTYWIERGYAHGDPEQDWLRAERELTSKQ